jgi:hypothetical protein
MEDRMLDLRVQPMGSLTVLRRVLKTACQSEDRRELSMKDRMVDVRVQPRGRQKECRTRHEMVHSLVLKRVSLMPYSRVDPAENWNDLGHLSRKYPPFSQSARQKIVLMAFPTVLMCL